MANVTNDSILYNTTNQDDGKVMQKVISIFFLSSAVLINICCILVLCRNLQLRNNRFYSLTIYQSISDIGMCVAATILAFLLMFEIVSPRFCIFYVGVMIAMIMCSMYQMLITCIDRLLTALEKDHSAFSKICSKKVMCIVYVLFNIYVISVYFFYGDTNAKSCASTDIIGENEYKLVYFIDMVIIFLTVAISLMYMVVIGLIINKYKRIKNLSPQIAERLRRNAVTLGMIIVVAFVSVVPGSCYSVLVMMNKESVSYRIRRITNSMYVIKPLLYPIIYVFRIRKFRHHLLYICCSNQQSIGPMEDVVQ